MWDPLDPLAACEGVQQQLEEREVGGGVGGNFLSLFLLPHPQHTHECVPTDFLPSFLPHCHSQPWRGLGTQVAVQTQPPGGGEECLILLLKGLSGPKSHHSEPHSLTMVMLPRTV